MDIIKSNLTQEMKGYKNIKALFGYYFKYPKYFAMFLILTFFSTVANFLIPILLGFMVEQISQNNLQQGIMLAFAIFGVSCVVSLLKIINVKFFKNLENFVKKDIETETLKKTLNLKMKYFDELGNGLFITRLTSDLEIISVSFIKISEYLMEFLSKIGFLVYIYFFNIYIALLLTAFVIIKYLVYSVRVYYYSILKNKYFNSVETVNSTIGESIRGVRDIKALNGQKWVLKRLNKQQDERIKIDNKEWYVGSFWVTFAEFITALFDLAFVALSAYLIGTHSLALAIFYTIYIYKNNVMNFATTVGEMQKYLKQIEVSAFRVFELQNNNKYEQDHFGTRELTQLSGNIKFNQVQFGYSKKERILNGITFEIEPNQSVAFVGESGCGKTTILNLLNKLYDIQSGSILLDDVNINELSEKSIRSNIATITQMPYIFNMSIKDNFKLGNLDVTEEQCWEVCKQVGLFKFVNELPEGLNTVIGESAAKLSGGQRQRLAIARALLVNSKILAFDESTSSLDNNSQSVIIRMINKLKKDKTIIIIAHRLNTIENCDKIFFIQNGTILAQGTHEQLLQSCTSYKNLYLKEMEQNTSK